MDAKWENPSPQSAPPTEKSGWKPGSTEFLPHRSTAEQKIISALDRQTEVSFQGVQLSVALEHFRKTHRIPIALDEDCVPPDLTVTLEASNLTLRNCLNRLLAPNCFLVENDELKVTTTRVADSKFVTRTYPVGDLFSTPEEAAELINVLECGLGLNSKDGASHSLIISHKSRAIVVRQTHRIHDQLLQLLRDLREAMAPQSDVPPTIPDQELPEVREAATRDLHHEIVLNLGYERNVNGAKRNEIPFVFYNESYVEVDQISPGLEEEKQRLEASHGKTICQKTTVIIRSDRDVPAAVIGRLMQHCRDHGFRLVELRMAAEPE